MAVVLQPGHNRRTLRDSVRRLFAQSSRSGNPGSSGMFDRAQNTNIHNATFNINHYGGGTSPASSRDFPSDNHGNTAVQQENMARTSRVSGIQERETSPRRRSLDVYVDLLLTKGHGYPLWIPSPNRSLPLLHRMKGVSIGDVGVLTLEGGFDFLFNIFYDSGNPINTAVGTPPGFMSFPHPVNSSNVQQFTEWNGGSYLSDASVTRIDDGRDTSKTVLRTAAHESAILMMPEDVHTTKMKSLFWLRQYFAKNIGAWYTYVKHTLGHDIENGDLKLVYGCWKSSGFGIATAFNAEHAGETQLTFSIIDESEATRLRSPYRWSHIGSAEVKTGPSELDRLSFPAPVPPQNQCLFVKTISVHVSSDTWKHIETLKAVMTDDSNNLASSSSTSSQHQATRQLQSDLTASGETFNPTSSYRLQEGIFHPSSILHGVLRQICPNADSYSVCDEDWSDLLTEDVMTASHLLDKVFQNSFIIGDGVVYFSRPGEIHNSDLHQGIPMVVFHRVNAVGVYDIGISQWKGVHLPREDYDSSILINLELDPPTYSSVPSSFGCEESFIAAEVEKMLQKFGKSHGETPTKSTESSIPPSSSLDAPRITKPIVRPTSSVLPTSNQPANESFGKRLRKPTNLTRSGTSPTMSLNIPASLDNVPPTRVTNPVVEASGSDLRAGDEPENDSSASQS